MKTNKIFIISCILMLAAACMQEKRYIDERTDRVVSIVPDYTFTTVPPNIAPLNFSLRKDSSLLGEGAAEAYAIFESGELRFEVDANDGFFKIPVKKWKNMLSASVGKHIDVTVVCKDSGKWKSYAPFKINIAHEPVDGWLSYRLIEPGYALWNSMGIYQRNLETYEESAIFENKMTDYGCVNCHSFCNRNPEKMMLHLRAKFPGTVLIDGNGIEVLDTKTDKTVSSFTYPSWHPSGDYIAFSINKVSQGFHAKHRIEVYDLESDVIVYDVKNKVALASDAVFSKNYFETFPSFSADGKTLYFCTAPACRMPDSVASLRYSLCAVSFEALTGKFGVTVDTLINARVEGRSVSFPRVSPDGKYLVCTVSSYGTFPIWHRDADLYIIDLANGKERPMDAANSDDVESYHSWSSNGRWLVFGSRRMDGLYTRPFITYIDENGCDSKPFVIPQEDADFYLACTKSFNIPEFINGKVPDNAYKISKQAKDDYRVLVEFMKK